MGDTAFNIISSSHIHHNTCIKEQLVKSSFCYDRVRPVRELLFTSLHLNSEEGQDKLKESVTRVFLLITRQFGFLVVPLQFTKSHRFPSPDSPNVSKEPQRTGQIYLISLNEKVKKNLSPIFASLCISSSEINCSVLRMWEENVSRQFL